MGKQLDLFGIVNQEIETSRTYRIPRRTESPAVTKGMAKSWIKDFCEWNNLELPRGFHKRDKKQIIGMYRGMLQTYCINEKGDILGKRDY